ncbi:MAG: YfbK domain-containing protein [Limisphaerales bacterium]
MNPDLPQNSREELEAALTALLLGELPPEQAAALRLAIERDPALAALHRRLKLTIELVRETAVQPADPAAAQPTPLKLSDRCREELLAHFKTVAPKEFARPRRQEWKSPVLVAAAAVLVGLLALAVFLPVLSQGKRRSLAMGPVKYQFALPDGAASRPLEDQSSVTQYSGGAYGGYSALQTNIVPYNSPNWAGAKAEQDRVAAMLAQANRTAIVLPGSTGASEAAAQTQAPGNGGPVVRTFKLAHADPNQLAERLSQLFSDASRSNAGPRFGMSFGGVGRPFGGPFRTGDQAASNAKDKKPSQVVAVPDPQAGSITVSAADQLMPHVAELVTQLDTDARPKVAKSFDLANVDPRDVEQVRQALLQSSATAGGNAGKEIGGMLRMTQNEPNPSGPSPRVGNYFSGIGGINTGAVVAGGGGGGGAPVPDAVFAIQPTLAPVAVAPAAGKPGAAPAPGSPAPAAAAPNPRPSQTLAYAERLLQPAAPAKSATAGSIETQAQAPILGDVPATGSLFRNEVAQSAAQKAELNKLDAAGRLDSLDAKAKRSPAQSEAARRWAFSQDGVNPDQQAGTNVGKAAVAAPVVSRYAYILPSAANAEGKREELKELVQAQAGVDRSDQPARRQRATSAPVPQPEVRTRENTFSTFSLNVSDVSFKLAAASLKKGMMPEPATVRSEEFINAFDYRDPEAPAGVPVAFACERARYPFAQNRDLLRFSLKTAAQGREAGRPLNLVLLLDNSGSMERADRVRIIHEALRVLAAQLQAQDKLSVVTFARTARLRVDGVPGSQAGHVAEEVGGLTPQGGTNLEEALNLAYETALRHYLANGINRVVLLTDGAANLGNVEPEALKQKVEAHRKQGVALDCFGIGWEGYNDDLLEVLSRNGDGRYGFLNTPEEAAAGFAGQLAGALRVAASDVKVQVQFNPARVTAYRQVGYARHQLAKEQFRDNTVSAAQIGAAESGNALYVIEIDPRGDGPLGVVRVRYKVPATGEYREQEWTVAYTGSAVPLEKAGPALRLAAVAGAFSEWLASSPFAAEATPERLLGYLGGVPDAYGPDARPRKLEWMIRQAQSLGRK